MTQLIQAVTQWWWSRTDRERQMLLIMAVLATVVLCWLAIIRPAVAWREAAAERRIQARDTLLKVDAGLRRLRREAPGTVAASPQADREAVVSQTAAAAGVTVTTGMDASGLLGFRVERTSSAQVFAWLATLRAKHNLEVSRLAVLENADATLQVDGAFAM